MPANAEFTNKSPTLGSDIPRILEIYGKECFKFFDNFIRMVFPKAVVEEESNQVGIQVYKLVEVPTTTPPTIQQPQNPTRVNPNFSL